ncbi:Exostosin-like protein [Dioscorea alata]|uniref:Exostosin-like protein n=1 Tax=Dioscorea alata TaxID=55571 RepID=A0ACB7U007_DIOAL|nr:Exostosin-like protein [Dioscorea alata]
MLPRSNSPPSGADTPHHSLPGKLTPSLNLHLHLPLCYRVLLVAAVLSVQLLLLLLFSDRSISTPRLHPSANAGDHRNAPNSTCDLGTIYVYDLPPEFNSDLIAGCHHLNPWTSRCSALSNFGLGPSAADLAGIVPDPLLPSWFNTDQFSSEILFHRRLLSHPCRSPDPSTASALFIPFYAGLAVGQHLWSPNATSGDRDRLCATLLRWISSQPSFLRSNGSDHFIVLGRITWDFRRSKNEDWGGSFIYMPAMSNVTRLLIERNPWDELDVGIPYPTGFHPRSATDVQSWQKFVLSHRRQTTFGFAGAARVGMKNDFRGLLLRECATAGSACKAVDCSHGRCTNRSAEAVSLFLESKFCLQPRGDSFTRRSMFDCMLAGAIPVVFWKRSAYLQYELYLPPGEEEWSVFIDRKEVRAGAASVREVLESIGEEKVRRMREKVVELIPRIVYGQDKLDEGMMDAVDVAVDGVLRRFRERRERTDMDIGGVR